MRIRNILTAAVICTCSLCAAAASPVEAVFTVLPKMHCENCENKIKSNLRFEKGVKGVETSIPDQKVTIKYDPDKTSEEKLAEAFSKIGYKASVCHDSSDNEVPDVTEKYKPHKLLTNVKHPVNR